MEEAAAVAVSQGQEQESRVMKTDTEVTELEKRCKQLEHEQEYMSGLIEVMRNDLQIKDEQFDLLYSSLRARTQQNVASRELDQSLLKSRVNYLESAICGRDRESMKLQARLQEAEHKLSQLAGGPPLSTPTTRLSRYSMSRIPDDIVGRILEYAGTQELGVMSCTDWYLNQFASMDRLWEPHFQNQWGRNKYVNTAKKMEEGKRSGMLRKPWKEMFGEKQVIESNWKRQRCDVTNLMAHNGTVTCIALRNNRMFSGSDDGSLICWEIDDSQPDETEDSLPKLAPPPALPLAQLVDAMSCGAHTSPGSGSESFHHQLHKRKDTLKRKCSKTRTFHGHGGPVWALDYDEDTDYLYSGSYDQTIKVWDVKTQACRRTLRGHTGWVSSVGLLNNHSSLLASASWDSTIRLWRVGEGISDDNADVLDLGYRVMNAGQGNALYCIGIGEEGRVINVGCRQHQIQRWDTEREVLVGNLLGHAKEVQALDAVGSNIVSGSGDGTAKLWDILTGNCCMTLRGHTDSVMTVQYDGGQKLVTGSYDKSVKVWDIRFPSDAVVTIRSHQGAVFCLKFDESRLVSGGADHFLKLFDFKPNGSNCYNYGCSNNFRQSSW